MSWCSTGADPHHRCSTCLGCDLMLPLSSSPLLRGFKAVVLWATFSNLLPLSSHSDLAVAVQKMRKTPSRLSASQLGFPYHVISPKLMAWACSLNRSSQSLSSSKPGFGSSQLCQAQKLPSLLLTSHFNARQERKPP